jgi:hypothetical protein
MDPSLWRSILLALRHPPRGDDMLHSRQRSSANWNTLKLATAAAAMAVLAGCAVAVRLPPLTTASRDNRNRDFACTANSKCSNAITSHQAPSRRSQPVGGGNIADDPPDFILNGEASMLR